MGQLPRTARRVPAPAHAAIPPTGDGPATAEARIHALVGARDAVKRTLVAVRRGHPRHARRLARLIDRLARQLAIARRDRDQLVRAAPHAGAPMPTIVPIPASARRGAHARQSRHRAA